MNHNENRNLQTKHELKRSRSLPVRKEMDICRNEKHYKIGMIIEYGCGNYTAEDLAKKNLSRIREIYDREVG